MFSWVLQKKSTLSQRGRNISLNSGSNRLGVVGSIFFKTCTLKLSKKNKRNKKSNLKKDKGGSFLWASYSWAWDRGGGWYPQWHTPLEKINFFLAWEVFIANGFLARDRTLCSLSSLSDGALPALNLCRSCTCCWRLGELVHASALLHLEDDVSLESPTTPNSCTL